MLADPISILFPIQHFFHLPLLKNSLTCAIVFAGNAFWETPLRLSAIEIAIANKILYHAFGKRKMQFVKRQNKDDLT